MDVTLPVTLTASTRSLSYWMLLVETRALMAIRHLGRVRSRVRGRIRVRDRDRGGGRGRG